MDGVIQDTGYDNIPEGAGTPFLMFLYTTFLCVCLRILKKKE
jgi:hypothetical protein